MNLEKHLILLMGEDKTNQIKHCKYENGKYHITFVNDKVYEYLYESVDWIRNPVNIDLTHMKNLK